MNEQARDQVPAKTTPTWEMELLVSGATIVGLLQLPAVMDRLYFRTANLSPQDYLSVLSGLWMYSKVTVTTLVLTFLVHLCLRGYWVALVGMASVYPGGIHWDRLGLGPIAREHFAAKGSIDDAIERADNRATRVFGVGVAVAMLMAGLSAAVLLALASAVAVDAFFGEGYAHTVFGIVIALIALPWALLSAIDRRFGGRWLDAAGKNPALGAIAGWSAGPRANPLIALFRSHVGRTKFATIMLLILMTVFVLVFAQIRLARGNLPFGLSAGFSGTDPESSSPAAFYEDERGDPWSMVPLPHIRSRTVDGPYVQLFIPFIPRLQGRDLPDACPELRHAGGADARLRMDCLGRVTALQLDDVPVAIALEATTDAATGQPGMLAMVPVGSLPSGRHELSLNSPDHPRGGAPQRYRIPFWK